CRDCGELTVAMEEPKACSKCGSKNIYQDSDVLDTWFSSGLWPHSTLGWPDETEDFKYFYPTSVMETGYDILFFWVARMIMMGLENTGDVPFRTVYLHGLIRDEKGDKMSKSRGNVVDPVKTIDKYGTDALRFALSTGNSPGNDMKLSPQKLEGSRNFVNKLWNAARFVITNLDGTDLKINRSALRTEDRWILSRLNHLTAEVAGLNEEFQFGEALRRIYDFLWTEYCDWYIEIAKIQLRGKDEKDSPLAVLVHVLEVSLRLLHPFMPFVTEELWQSLREHQPQGKADSIMIAPYPVADAHAFDAGAEQEMESVFEIVRSVRNARVESNVDPGRFIKAFIVAGESRRALETHAEAITALARVRPLTIAGSEQEVKLKRDQAKILVLKGVEVILPLEGMVDTDAEKGRLLKEVEATQAEVSRIERLLSEDSFIAKAPPAVVDKERQKLAERRDKLGRLNERLNQLG
ncbi:MAG: class I tRNA ligase family protein, partial [Chloroflexi bacterium]|nr:class I tRNA ligase family protein [Chloroflexota bacterium]